MGKLDDLEDFHPLTRDEWRRWLRTHHDASSGVWFVFFKKHTGKPRVNYDESVEEALCFGWIDSLARKFDDERSKLLFTPRKPKSVWSKPNKERVAAMISGGLMTRYGSVKIDAAKLDGSWDALNSSDNLRCRKTVQGHSTAIRRRPQILKHSAIRQRRQFCFG
ncbi:MAG: hypothetical protein ABIU09_01210 [Pyrinomonadaceae bacterium]